MRRLLHILFKWIGRCKLDGILKQMLLKEFYLLVMLQNLKSLNNIYSRKQRSKKLQRATKQDVSNQDSRRQRSKKLQ